MTTMNMKHRALAWAFELLRPGCKPWVVLDTETTALDSDAEVIELAAIGCDGDVLLHSLVQCQGFITPKAEEVHGITKEDLKHAPSFPDVWGQLEEVFKLRPWVIAYNMEFDLRMLRQTRERYGIRSGPILANVHWDCLMHRYAWVHGEPGRFDRPVWQSLSNAIAQQAIQVDWKWHRALGDCQASLALLRKMAEIAEAELPREEVPHAR